MSFAFSIRPFTPADAAAIALMRERSIRQIGARAYSAAQIEAWAARSRDAGALAVRMGDGRQAFIAVDGSDAPAGFIDLEDDGHIDMLYTAPEAAGQGIAGRMLAHVEALARQAGMGLLHTEASEVARPVFERHGFEVTHRRDFEIDGVPIHNYKMEKRLKAS